jgi:ATP-dependent helicase/nuclease subunit A
MNKPLPPDQAARDRAVADLTTNLLVEAGAGSGKTTLMADRIVAMVKAKYPADQIAAVTFTRKAASELRERVQLKLEKAHEAPERANEIFIGTIHSFCARLLRERPVEAGLDPRFRELDEIESQSLAETFWASWIERLFVSDHPLLRRLREVDVQPTRLHDAFLTFVTYPDVEFPSPDCPAPAIGDLVAQLKAFIARGVSLMPSEPPAAGWDDVQNQLWRLHFEQRARDWSRPADFFDSLVHLGESSPFTQNRWVRDESQATAQKRTAKVFVEELQQWRCGPAAEALTQWHEHCYAPVVAVASEAAAAFAKYRMATSRLSFEDLRRRRPHRARGTLALCAGRRVSGYRSGTGGSAVPARQRIR